MSDYDQSKDVYRKIHDLPKSPSTFAAPATRCAEITPHDSNHIDPYPKALRVFVPDDASPGVGYVRVVPLMAESDADYVELTFPAGLTIEPLAVRMVLLTGITAGVEIHGYFDR